MQRNCCIECFSDHEIKGFIRNFENQGNCDYCGSKNVLVCEVSEVGEFIHQGVLRKYEDPAESVAYESKEGGYLLPLIYIYEILNDEESIFGDKLDDPSCLLEDIVKNFSIFDFVRKDPYGPRSGGIEQIESWNEFCEIVKYKHRFTSLIQYEDDDLYEDHPIKILEAIANSCNNTFFWQIPPGTKIFRARLYDGNWEINNNNLTSPPLNITKNQRMSPAGISYFYSAFDTETCINEVCPNLNDNIIVAEFEALKNLQVLNLTLDNLLHINSIFSENYNFVYDEYLSQFLRHFISEISKPIRPETEIIDYVPTQIFTEYIKRYDFPEFYSSINASEKIPTYKVDGLMYKSSLKEGGENIVLFKGNDISKEIEEQSDDAWLLYKGFKKYQITDISISYK